MEEAININQLILQLAITLVPVFLAYLKQRGEIVKLRADNQAMRIELTQLKQDHVELQAEYKANLKAQAGMRDSF